MSHKLDRDLSQIYTQYIISDHFETYINKNNEWSMGEYVTIFSVYYLSKRYKQYKTKQKPIIYNKYISRSMTSVGNKTTLMDIEDMSTIYYYMYAYFVEGDAKYLPMIKILNAKQLRLLSKGLAYFYHYSIKQSELQKISR